VNVVNVGDEDQSAPRRRLDPYFARYSSNEDFLMR